MKKVVLTITLTFADKVSSDEDLQEVAENIADAIKHASNTYKIAPENSDTFLTAVEVSSDVLEVSATRQIVP